MDSATYNVIKNLFDDYIEMYSSRNDKLTNHFSPDFSGFAGGSDVLVKDMKEWIAVTRQDFAQVKERLLIDIKDLAIQSLSEDVAVATSFFTIKLPIEDDYFSRETVRLVLIFHKRDGGWKIAHSSISVPYALVGKGEIYPLKGLEERNKLLERIISERTRELEKSNSSLKDSELRYRRLFEAAKDGILILDAESGMFVDVNPSLLHMLGSSREELVNKKAWELEFLKHIIASRDHFLELRQKRYIRHDDVALEAGDGRRINVEFVISVYDVDHQHVMQCNLRDISDRKQAEEALRISRERNRLLFEHTPVGVILADREGQILEVNPLALQILGLPSAEATKAINILTFPPLVTSGISAALKHCVDSGRGNFDEYRYVTKWGKTIQMRLRYVPILDTAHRTMMMNILIEDVTEQRKEEAKSAQLAAIVESSDEVVISTTLDAVITSWNAGAEKIYGYNEREIVGKPITVLFPPDRTDEMAEVLKKIKSGERLSRFETVRQAKNGQLIEMSLTVSSIKDKEGNIIGVSTIGSDITDRKRAETALRESEERFHRLFDLSPDAFLIFDPFSSETEWPILDCNQSACEMNGYTREELIGKSVYFLDPIQETHEGREAYLKGIRQGKILRFEATHRHSDGHLFPIEVSNSIMTFRGRQLVFGIDRDITERKSAEEKLRRSDEIIKRVNSLILIADANGQITYASPSLKPLLGYEAAEVLGDGWWRLSQDNPREQEEAKEKVARTAAGEIPIREEAYETMEKTKEGETRWILWQDSKGVGGELIGVGQDITDRKKAEDALRRAQKLESIGTLAGGIAHDFNNLLNAMLGQSALALGKLPADSRAKYHIEKSIQAADRAADLTRQLLAYSGKGKFVTEEFDLNLLVQENAQLLRVSVSKTAQLKYEMHPSPLFVHGDVGQIQQVIMNLIINASEAMGSNPGSITIRTNHIEIADDSARYNQYTGDLLPPGRYVLLQVTDTGGGMSKDVMARIFDPFFTTKFTGRGLGLAAVLGIVRGHKGGVRIESEVGRGTTFEIVFPLASGAAKAENQASREMLPMDGAGRTILVIDDEESVVDLLNDVLTGAEFKVLQALDPIDGISIYREHHKEIALVVLDYSMPNIDGKATFEELVKINKEVRVLLCSGYSEEEMQSGFGEVRPTGFIKKPYRPSELLARVSGILLG
ncbi:MAG TPA: PAS domain S-box protein [Bacteroidota bacterium]|nr:PAS domain S-box protein [Bacteroidota bacterium]